MPTFGVQLETSYCRFVIKILPFNGFLFLLHYIYQRNMDLLYMRVVLLIKYAIMKELYAPLGSFQIMNKLKLGYDLELITRIKILLAR